MRGDSRYGARESVALVGRRYRRRSSSPCDLRPAARLRPSPTPLRSPGGSVSAFSDEDGDFGPHPDYRGGGRRVRRRRRRRVAGDEDEFELRNRRRVRACDRVGDSRSPEPARGGFRRGGRAPAARAREFSPAHFSDDSRGAPPQRACRRRVAEDPFEASTSGVNAIPLGRPERAPSRTPSVDDEEVCLDFRRGKCRFGDTCKFSHGDGKIEVCMDFKRGRCRFMDNCKFSHGDADAEFTKNKATRRVWVMHTDCAKVIGKGGRAMREVEEKTRTLLKVQPERDMESTGASKERYVDIIGTKENCEAAVQLILEQTRYLREDDGKVVKDIRASDEGIEETPMVIEVKPEDVGRVIGRKGDMIKEIEQKSSTKVEVDKVTGKLEIFGKTEAQEQALELILLEVSFAKSIDGTILKEETRAKKDNEDVPKTPPMVVWIKDDQAGRVIGKGGETIHDMMRKSCTDIKVQKLEELPPREPGQPEGPREREIRIFGDKEQQDQALSLLLNEVSWCRNAGGVLKDVPDERQNRKRKKQEPREKKEEDREDDGAKGGNSKRRGGGSSGLWVCATCGGDHRTKECPYTIGMGMQLGMQMSMQAMGMAMPPGMAPMPGMPPMMPGMPPMMGMPGMPGMLPGRPSQQAPRSESEYSYGSAGSSRASSVDGAAGFPMNPGVPVRTRAHREPVVRPSAAPGIDHAEASRSRHTQSTRQTSKRLAKAEGMDQARGPTADEARRRGRM